MSTLADRLRGYGEMQQHPRDPRRRVPVSDLVLLRGSFGTLTVLRTHRSHIGVSKGAVPNYQYQLFI